MNTLLVKQLRALIQDESNVIANLSNVSALLNAHFDQINWVGFYLWDDQDQELVLGPFQGKVACNRIPMGRGVCGSALQQQQTLIVPDVHAFAGHIACDSASRSEIVVPIIIDGQPFGVLDIDAPVTNRFTTEDQALLEACIDELKNVI
ncbi:histidine kinase [Dolosigranulum pigrum]|uniref:GAF domain-containing protein n=1 Tax=Dolosigranulum pigrum TaxID=29394 RepID=UPI000DBF6A2B|nr:GAF domain-containing protein [Dolosigranulum pigrum]QTJ44724.1 GAF domain-containing protein [Dolosigranulum pigrum]QTJ55030.1 GAF domain-containing protein [Dolosigranulum pigrum]RAN54813.1 histidine kinase [Dolosigranulum pigrum]